nr:putative lrr receptor-like serine/threonine-protein kinase [Quercus suber]
MARVNSLHDADSYLSSLNLDKWWSRGLGTLRDLERSNPEKWGLQMKRISMKVISLLVPSLFFLSAMGQLPSQDILALLEFKKSIKHDPTGYVLSSWNGYPSSWNRIVCNCGNVAGAVGLSLCSM